MPNQIYYSAKMMLLKMVVPVFCMLALMSSGANAQSTVTGKVIGADGVPVEGVSVVEQGTTNGATTGESGNFTLTVKDLNATLVISSVGYTEQKIALKGQSDITVVLEKSGAKELEQIVVIGYGAAQKRDLTGSIVSIDAEEIANRPATNALSLLSGKVAGLTVVNSGRPGAEPDIRIRGTSSINGVRPVYVVDGILNNNINFLNPADIASIEILKDPSSLAIFGVRGANGAIVITTKKAKAGQTNVNFNTSVGLKVVQDKMELTNGDQFRELVNEQFINDGEEPMVFDPYWTANTNWQDEIFQKGVVTYNHLSLSNATEKNRIYLGLGYTSEQGVIKNELYKKYTLNFTDELKVTDNLKFGVVFNGYRAELPLERGVDGAMRAAPIGPVWGPAGKYLYTLPSFQRAQVFNPLFQILYNEGTLIAREFRAVGSIYGDWTFLNDFNFRVQLFADYGFNTRRSYQNQIFFYNPDKGGDNIDSIRPETAVFQSQNIFPKTQMDYLLTYKKDFDKHEISVLAGITSYYQKFEGVGSSVQQGGALVIPNNPDKWYVDKVGDPATKVGSGSAWEDASLSYLARVLYNFDEKYLINASFRRDGSSQFYPLNNAWKNFGAVGLGWIISRENFFNNQEFFDLLKLKGSWGVLGSKNIDDDFRYPAYPTLTNRNSGVFGENVVPAIEPEYIVDPSLTWEEVHSYEVGIEADFMDRDFHFEANYYSRLTKNVITLIQGPTGTNPVIGNLGEIENKGLEFIASWQKDFSNGIGLQIAGNLTTINNKVIKLNKTGFRITAGTNGVAWTEAGLPIGVFYGYRHVGIYQSNADIKQSPKSSITVYPGDIKFADINGDGEITPDDRTIIGNPTPDFTYGGAINLNYKGIDFGLDLQGVYGNEIYRAWNIGQFATMNYQIARLDRWHGAGTSNWEPLLSLSHGNNYENSTYFIEDGSFFRVRNVQLGYTFKPDMLNKAGIKSLRIYVNAQNIATFANNTGYTPEIGGSPIEFGIDNGTYPVPTIYSAGLNLNF